jgi:hypothetical protein
VLIELAGEINALCSVNLYLLAIRHVIKAALRDGHIKPPLPFEGLGWQRVDTKSRPLYSPDEVDPLCGVALTASTNGPQLI